jgi:hypothetical protein
MMVVRPSASRSRAGPLPTAVRAVGALLVVLPRAILRRLPFWWPGSDGWRGRAEREGDVQAAAALGGAPGDVETQAGRAGGGSPAFEQGRVGQSWPSVGDQDLHRRPDGVRYRTMWGDNRLGWNPSPYAAPTMTNP